MYPIITKYTALTGPIQDESSEKCLVRQVCIHEKAQRISKLGTEDYCIAGIVPQISPMRSCYTKIGVCNTKLVRISLKLNY